MSPPRTATSPTATAAATPPRTQALALPPTGTATTTLTPIITRTPTPSPIPAPPEILVFGVARADDLVQAADAVDAAGRPVFERAKGQGMTVFVEARRGSAPCG